MTRVMQLFGTVLPIIRFRSLPVNDAGEPVMDREKATRVASFLCVEWLGYGTGFRIERATSPGVAGENLAR